MKKLLALNRGEIAIRILRAANELKLRTVAVYSQEDRLSLHRFKADEAYLVGQGKGPVQAYLDIDRSSSWHRKKTSTPFIPGYGFLAENPDFPGLVSGLASHLSAQAPNCWRCWGTRRPPAGSRKKRGIPVVPGTEDPVDPERGRRRRAR